jgi:hypothetical protein
MATKDEAASALSAAEREHVNEALFLMDQLGSTLAHRAYCNINSEFRVPETVWATVFRELLRVDLRIQDRHTAARVLEALRAALTKCLKPPPGLHPVPTRLPVGPAIPGLEPKAYGRIVALPTLVYYWKTAILGGPTRPKRVPAEVIRDHIALMSTAEGLASRGGSPVLESLPLGLFVIWSTFDGERLEIDPFPPRPLKIEDMAAIMGLDYTLLFGEQTTARRPKAHCVLMTYTLPSDIAPHTPSVVEAYAGTSKLNYFFEVYQHEVNVALRHFPRTMATPRAADKAGVPEVVHQVVFADQLLAPLQQAVF